MIRGRNFFSLAVRRQDGTIFRQQEPLNNMFNGPIRRVPLLRGVLVLLESLALGMKALRRSANIAMQEDQGDEHEELPAWAMAWLIALAVPVEPVKHTAAIRRSEMSSAPTVNPAPGNS